MQRLRAAKPENLAARQYRKKSSALRTLRRVMDHSQELVFVTDESGVVQYANPACKTLCGYSAHELTEKSLSWIGAAVPKGDSWDSMRDQALRKGASRGVTGLRCKQGGVVELDVVVTVVRDPRTEVASLAWTGRVVAQQHAIKAEIERSRKMDAIGTFAGGIVHDFNNLLMVIGAYADMGLTSVPAEHAVRRNLREILEAVRRASDLTRRLLTFGRPQAGGQQLTSLNWIIEDAVGMLSRLIEEDIEIRVSLGEDVSLIRADPGEIEQVLLNLAVNARDAMPNGGELVIETRLVRLSHGFARYHPGITEGDHVLLMVTDSGHGMRSEELTRIFEPFYTTKAEGKGTGLGLAIVQSIVQQNRGIVSAASEPGMGTSFNIYLPIAAPWTEKKRSSSRSNVVPTLHGNEALLVVEDADSLRHSTAEFLTSLGYQVRSAANGQEALNTLKNEAGDIALVITDVVMPRMSGPGFAQAVAGLQLPIRVLFMSGHVENVVRRKGVQALEGNFLQKPFSLKSLALKIREVLDEPVPAHTAATATAR
ncbi:MAG: Histidine kinase [Acidobacteriaceae bacterium]|nr:Histidine kinase [Acidobacteriaceae bacterium]